MDGSSTSPAFVRLLVDSQNTTAPQGLLVGVSIDGRFRGYIRIDIIPKKTKSGAFDYDVTVTPPVSRWQLLVPPPIVGPITIGPEVNPP